MKIELMLMVAIKFTTQQEKYGETPQPFHAVKKKSFVTLRTFHLQIFFWQGAVWGGREVKPRAKPEICLPTTL